MGLPIGFDRIGWKHESINLSERLTSSLPIGFDRIGWKRLVVKLTRVRILIAYRLASIGLVGNRFSLKYASWICGKLTDWLRSDWLETIFCNAFPCKFHSLPIGFDRIGWKPDSPKRRELQTVHCLPIGFDRIGWKLFKFTNIQSFFTDLLTDWLRSDWLETL